MPNDDPIPWDISYSDWYESVGQLVEANFGELSIDDFPDWPSRDWYDDGLSVEEAYESWQEYQDELS